MKRRILLVSLIGFVFTLFFSTNLEGIGEQKTIELFVGKKRTLVHNKYASIVIRDKSIAKVVREALTNNLKIVGVSVGITEANVEYLNPPKKEIIKIIVNNKKENKAKNASKSEKDPKKLILPGW